MTAGKTDVRNNHRAETARLSFGDTVRAIRFIMQSLILGSMGFDFQFRTLGSQTDLKGLVDFLAKQDLSYPRYDQWVQKTEGELGSGSKTPIIAYSNGHIVGDLIYQPHKELPRVRELKNLRIHPEVRRRDFAHFMLRQAECEGNDAFDLIVCDARKKEQSVVNLLLFSGYTPIGSKPLYDQHSEDIIFVKTMDGRTESGLVYKTKGFILG